MQIGHEAVAIHTPATITEMELPDSLAPKRSLTLLHTDYLVQIALAKYLVAGTDQGSSEAVTDPDTLATTVVGETASLPSTFTFSTRSSHHATCRLGTTIRASQAMSPHLT